MLYMYREQDVMAKQQINVRLDEDFAQRLEALAQRTGRTKTFYAELAIQEFLEDREDYFLAKDSLEAFRQSGDHSLEISELEWGTPST
jgi:RHH-type rel operon transcriptional repressor/antitoxin RelB